MKPDRPLILSVVFLAWGLGLIFGYCSGTAGMSAAWPLSTASLNICTTTNGPGALGGVALTLLGVFLLLLALLCAVVSQVRMLLTRKKKPETPMDKSEDN